MGSVLVHGNGYPCFNFAHFTQLTVGEFKTRANTHSHIEYSSVYMATGRIKKFSMRGRKKGRANILGFTVQCVSDRPWMSFNSQIHTLYSTWMRLLLLDS